MAMNPIPFQPGLSMVEFVADYGTKAKCRRVRDRARCSRHQAAAVHRMRRDLCRDHGQDQRHGTGIDMRRVAAATGARDDALRASSGAVSAPGGKFCSPQISANQVRK